MIDTNEMKSLAYNKLRDPIEIIFALCDEIDRLRGEKQTPPHDDESELTSMCMTYRHDYGLLSNGEQVDIRYALRRIYEHHVKPLLRSKPSVPPQGKTVRVKVAVGVEPTGKWNAFGWSHGTDAEKMELAVEPLDPGEARFWRTATLPVPQEVEVVAEVEK